MNNITLNSKTVSFLMIIAVLLSGLSSSCNQTSCPFWLGLFSVKLGHWDSGQPGHQKLGLSPEEHGRLVTVLH